MKKLALLLCCLIAVPAMAIIAPRMSQTVKQPDGSEIEIRLHGDEFGHWATSDGAVVRLDEGGYWRQFPAGDALRLSYRSMSMRMSSRRMRAESGSVSTGERKIPVILLAFSDQGFSVEDPKRAFSSMLNSTGYSSGGATGSLAQYMRENSNGDYSPEFEVYGPYKLSNGYAHYGANGDDGRDENAEAAFFEAVQKADGDVDFSQYDEDGDGVVDAVLFFFAGHDEAEYGGEDTIWPYQYSMQYSDDATVRSATFDGKKLGRYACAAELRGDKGTTMAGIGTIAHEFSHILGLPDFYDSDGETNGEALTLGDYSLMCYGPYKNNGNTPPFYTYLERQMLGWVSDAPLVEESGEYSLYAVYDDDALRYESTTEGETFLIERRNGTSWDAYVQSGILIYHIDRSSRLVHGKKALLRWTDATLNNYSDHPCCYLVRAYDNDKTGYWAYPGLAGVTEAKPTDWNGYPAGFSLSGITKDGKFTVSLDDPSLAGTVADSDGNVLAGATVSLGEGGASATTDAYGSYSLAAEAGTYEVVASLSGYQSQTQTATLSHGTTVADFSLAKEGERVLGDLFKYDDASGMYMSGFGENPVSLMAAVGFSAEELADYAGMRISSISFYMDGTTADHVYVMVDVGDSRVLLKEVKSYSFASSGKPTTVDVTASDVRIPEGQDMYVGYGLDNVDSEYPMIIDGGPGVEGGAYYNYLLLEKAEWYPLQWKDDDGTVSSSNLYIRASVEDPNAKPADTGLGYSYIVISKSAWAAGEGIPLKLSIAQSRKLSKASWTLDGAVIGSGTVGTDGTYGTVTASSGFHTLSARLDYADGTYEIIEKAITIK